MLLNVIAAVPVLFTMIACGLLGVPMVCVANVKELGLTDIAGVGVKPVPVMGTVCGLPAALSAMLMLAEREPLALGVKVANIVHDPPARTEEPQLLLCAKSAALVPVTPMLEIVSVTPPVL